MISSYLARKLMLFFILALVPMMNLSAVTEHELEKYAGILHDAQFCVKSLRCKFSVTFSDIAGSNSNCNPFLKKDFGRSSVMKCFPRSII